MSRSCPQSLPSIRKSLDAEHNDPAASAADKAMPETLSPILHQAILDSVARHRSDGLRDQPACQEPNGDPEAECASEAIGLEDEDSGLVPNWKRVLDILLVLVASPIWLPLMLVVMLVVRLSSPGPIFYCQERVGYRRKRFMICKFRTMKIDADTHTHESYFETLVREGLPMTKLDLAGDPRIIPCGRFLRASGLDELPQIFNIMRGEMSVVGPRPCTVREFEGYLPWQQSRVNAVPGLTGYWQVNGKNRTTFNQMIEMDIFYAEHMSLALDLKIILKTFSVLLDQTFAIVKRVPAETSSGAFDRSLNGVAREQGAGV